MASSDAIALIMAFDAIYVFGSAHKLKCSFFYGAEGKRIVGYDNERGKNEARAIIDTLRGRRFVNAWHRLEHGEKVGEALRVIIV